MPIDYENVFWWQEDQKHQIIPLGWQPKGTLGLVWGFMHENGQKDLLKPLKLDETKTRLLKNLLFLGNIEEYMISSEEK